MEPYILARASLFAGPGVHSPARLSSVADLRQAEMQPRLGIVLASVADDWRARCTGLSGLSAAQDLTTQAFLSGSNHGSSGQDRPIAATAEARR